jgi:hypothetical protein
MVLKLSLTTIEPLFVTVKNVNLLYVLWQQYNMLAYFLILALRKIFSFTCIGRTVYVLCIIA